MTEVFILSGFLGAGKTSMLKNILETASTPDTVVLINEFGKLGLDGKVLETKGLRLYELNNGCICCTLNTTLAETLRGILDYCHPKTLLIEASGVANPLTILEVLRSFPPEEMRLVSVSVVLDARMWPRRKALGAVFEAQLEQADCIILNKKDLLPPAVCAEVYQEVQQAYPHTTVTVTEHGRVALDIMRTQRKLGLFPFSNPASSAYETLSYCTDTPLCRKAVEAFFADPPKGLLRAKGQILFPEASAYVDFVDGLVTWSEPLRSLSGTCLVFIGTALETSLADRLRTLELPPSPHTFSASSMKSPILQEPFPQRACLKAIFTAGVQAVAPDNALFSHVHLEGELLTVGNQRYDLQGRRIFVLGAGKGAAPMAQALEQVLGTRITAGHIIVKYGHALPLRSIRLSEAGHPVPDHAGELATRQLLALASQVQPDDLVFCLFTGGASALTPAPVPQISLADMQATTNVLMACGATIDELNAVRKHLSLWSGGQLARLLAPAEVCTLVVSDVVGDALSVIASGPTVPDPSTFDDCLELIDRCSLRPKLPPAVRYHLETGAAGEHPETPKEGDPIFRHVQTVLIASNAQALKAAGCRAAELGFSPSILSSTLTGEARSRAHDLVAEARSLLPTSHPLCLLAGGETTVTLHGSGKGGRNQEMALSAALLLENEPRIVALFAGTDGTDGPTDAAGGFAHARTALAIRQTGNDPNALLANNDSYTALGLSNDLLITGPTRTNVMDMSILLVLPE